MRFILVADPDVNDVVVAEQDIAGVMSMGVKGRRDAGYGAHSACCSERPSSGAAAITFSPKVNQRTGDGI